MSTPENGLTSAEAAARLRQYGPNTPPGPKGSDSWRLLVQLIREPMFGLLVIACTLYFFLGESEQGALMAAAIVFVTAISYYQQMRSTGALKALNRFFEPGITVIRDGREQPVPTASLVPGDLFLIEEGNRVPADAIVVECNDLSVNESILTGESLPVEKHIGNDNSRLFQGTLVSSGRACALVTATGRNTQLGKLGKQLSGIPVTRTTLQKQIDSFLKTMTLAGIAVFLLIWAVNFAHDHNLAQSLLQGLTLAMSVIPEEIPVAFSSFMALGAFYMARHGIITRQPSTIENLGAVSVICLDKTGTITENRMSVAAIYDHSTRQLTTEMIPGNRVLYFARLASEVEPFDPMEKAIASAWTAASGPYPPMIHEYPLGGHPPMMTHVYRVDGRIIVAGKGAPERILSITRLPAADQRIIRQHVDTLAKKGCRVLGIASATAGPQERFPPDQDGFDWHFEGLLALFDPPKPGIAQQMQAWRQAGIKVKLVTGDYPETALTIASMAGVPIEGKPVSGDEWMAATPKEAQRLAADNSLFVRMFPDAKKTLVETLEQQGGIVAMIGDGVNDALALKAAGIGIAMGIRGTEMARNAADLILTEDNLDRVTEAIRQGRKIGRNLRNAIRYILSIHIPIMAAAAVPVFLNWRYPNIFTPIHVIFLELIMGPTCSIFFEKEPAGRELMKLPPRPIRQSLFTPAELSISALQGIFISLGVLLLYHHMMRRGYPLPYVRTLVFLTLVIANVFLTLVDRSFTHTLPVTLRYKNPLLKYTLSASIAFLVLLLTVPSVRTVFGLQPLPFRHILLCLAIAMAATGWFEIGKAIRSK
ncbi:MAG TPA: cation-translocating P-type ATPase [Puia sp.]|uniref:cation-translocating P-type ATPase n=1 Tax=Puia sp. TaxID=2045100 RepID=UPI002CF7F228|nr:cation-translocating P-type ATPase [Puia sp.]HVU94183.1 cation-translocating P-type ATPase [Puia sp.]